jgi:hypothetical protein
MTGTKEIAAELARAATGRPELFPVKAKAILDMHAPKQSRSMSAAEAVTNVVAGFVVAVGVQVVVFPMFDIHVSASEHVGIAAFFVVASIVRSYVLRRIFEKYRT